MAYPIIPAPYGLKPVNLIGGQVFSGSTRLLPIQYNFATNIYYGDFVAIQRGYAVRATVTTGASAVTGAPNSGVVGNGSKEYANTTSCPFHPFSFNFFPRNCTSSFLRGLKMLFESLCI